MLYVINRVLIKLSKIKYYYSISYLTYSYIYFSFSGTPPVPRVQLLGGTSVLVHWDEPGDWNVECRHLASQDWFRLETSNSNANKVSRIVEDLCVGEAYIFRLVGSEDIPGPATPPLIIPAEDGWQREQFSRRYQELSEIGRGRFVFNLIEQYYE